MSEGNSNRYKEIDILKGILISLVVIGHSDISLPYIKNIIYWFHMPLFFCISGFLFKEDVEEYRSWSKKKINRYMIPYLSYFILISLLSLDLSYKTILRFILGGRAIGGVYWFVTCLLFTILIFSYLIQKFNKKQVIAIIIIMGLFGIIESNFFIPKNINHYPLYYKFPLGLDVSLIAIIYFSIGYYFKGQIIDIIDNNSISSRQIEKLIISIIIISVLIILMVLHIYTFVIDMKYVHYYNIILIVIVPICFLYILLIISKFIKKNELLSRILIYIGKRSLVIMYLHIFLLNTCKNIASFGKYSWIIYSVLTIIICCIFSQFVSLNKFSKKIFITG